MKQTHFNFYVSMLTVLKDKVFHFFKSFPIMPRISSTESVLHHFFSNHLYFPYLLVSICSLFRFSAKLYFHCFFGLSFQILPVGFQFSIILGSLLSTILLTWPNNLSLLSSIFVQMPVFTFDWSPISIFVFLSNLDVLVAILQ